MTKKNNAALAALPESCVLSLRTHPRNPNHHLWWNNGTWWLHATVHHPNYTKERVRVSLGTKDRDEARERRDFILGGTNSIVSHLSHTLARPEMAGHGCPPGRWDPTH